MASLGGWHGAGDGEQGGDVTKGPHWTSGRAVRFILAGVPLSYGVFSSSLFADVSAKWAALTLAVFALPLAAQIIPSRVVQVYGIWLGIFLVAQSAASAWITGNYKALPPNLAYTLNVTGNALPGIQGIQHITTDANGFRVKPPVDYTAKSGLRIFAIGGSTTEQIYLDDKATWTYLLQEGLRRRLGRPVEVINTGASGLRALHHLATLRLVLGYQPDLALFMIGVNDWNRHIRSHFRSEDFRREEMKHWRSQYLFQNSLIGQFARGLAARRTSGAIREEAGSFYLARRGSLARAEQHAFAPATVSEEYVRHLAAISETCRQAGLPCIFITQPNGYSPAASESYRASFWMTPPNEAYTLDFRSMVNLARLYNNYLLAFALRNGHAVIDLASRLSPSHENFYDDVHFNIQGARNAARILVESLAGILEAQRNWRGTRDGRAEKPVGSGALPG